MKNKELWKPSQIQKTADGKFIGSHMHKILGYSHEPIIRKYAKGILADVGCGNVPYYLLYKDYVDDNICVDWGREDGEISFLDHVADLNRDKIAIDTNAVDTILCTDVLEHISQPEHLFSEMARIMKPGGHMILTVPFMYWIHDSPYDYHRYTKFKLADFCERNGLEVVEISKYGGLPEVIYDLIYKGFNYDYIPMKRPFFFIWRKLGSMLYGTRMIKRITEKTNDVMPLGYVLVARKK